jgi:hypothetical protein
MFWFDPHFDSSEIVLEKHISVEAARDPTRNGDLSRMPFTAKT